MKKSDMRAIVIGSGIAGLASALRLRKKGYQVNVFESGPTYGGKMDAIEKNGYRWDAGPSLFTMPHFIEELFELFNQDPSKYFKYRKKDTVCNYFWPDGKRFVVHADTNTFIKEASLAFETNEKELSRYIKNSRIKYDLTAEIFLEKSLHRPSTYMSLSVLNALLQSYKLNLTSTLDQVNKRYFRDPHLVQLFNRYATYNGSSPYKTPGIMSLIPHLEMHYGTYLPKGGMRSIPRSLFELGTDLGIQYRFSQPVTRILHDGKKATGVETNEGSFEADIVVTNMDIFFTYKKLLPDLTPPKKILKQERSSSAFVFYWGVKKSFKELDLHNIFFSKDYKEEFEFLFDRKEVYHDPTIYINITSKDEQGDAPEGCENWFVMVNVPADEGQDWQGIRSKVRKIIINQLNEYLDVDLNQLIEVEEVLDPVTIESKTNSYKGALYGTSSNTQFAAFLRHPNFSNQLKNLFFCGGSAHPGGGIPLCLQSAKIVSQLVPEA